MTTLTLTNREIQSIATLTPIVPKDLVSPILQKVRLTIAGGIVTLTGTDRYSAVRMSFRAHEQNPDLTVLLGVHDVASFAGNLRSGRADPLLQVAVTVDEADLEAEGSLVFEGFGERVEFVEPKRMGFFPDIERIFPAAGMDGPFADTYRPTAFDMGLLGRLAKLRMPRDFIGKRHAPRESAYALRFLPAREGSSVTIAYLFRRESDESNLGLEMLLYPNVEVS